MSVEAEFRQVLANMEAWLSYGTTMNFQATGATGESGRPPGEEFPLHLEWRARWNRTQLKGRCLEEAVDALEQARKQKIIIASFESQGQLEDRIVREGVGWSVKDVANHCRCTEKQVRKARGKAGANLEDGKHAALAPVDGFDHARQLANEGLTERQIAMITKLPKTTVRRALGRAA